MIKYALNQGITSYNFFNSTVCLVCEHNDIREDDIDVLLQLPSI